MEINDTNWETLFWSLMKAIENIDEAVDVYEAFEIAGMELDAEENE